MSIEVGIYGDAAGGMTHTISLTNGAMKAVFTDYGARLIELWVPDRNGDLADVVLAAGNIATLQADKAYFGATCGRFANRIKGGQFTLDGKRYQVDLNNGPNQLHGGPVGFDKHIWRFEVDEANTSVRFFHDFTRRGSGLSRGSRGQCRVLTRHRFPGHRHDRRNDGAHSHQLG